MPETDLSGMIDSVPDGRQAGFGKRREISGSSTLRFASSQRHDSVIT